MPPHSQRIQVRRGTANPGSHTIVERCPREEDDKFSLIHGYGAYCKDTTPVWLLWEDDARRDTGNPYPAER